MPQRTTAVLGGTTRLGGFRLGYMPAGTTARRSAHVTLTINGIATRWRAGSLQIRDVLNADPNTCDLIVDSVNPPTAGQVLRITCGVDSPVLLFAGTIQTAALTYRGEKDNTLWPCTAIDHTARLNRRRPFGTYVDTSATTIALAIAAAYAPAFGVSHVQAALPAVSIVFDGASDFIGCLTTLAAAIGGYCKIDDLEIYLFLTDTDNPPDDLDETAGRLLNDPPIEVSTDVSQLRTRVYGKGHGEALLGDVNAGETKLPIGDASLFNPSGGQAIAGVTADGAQAQRIAYTGVVLGGAGSLVGPGAAPSVAPTLAGAAGAGLSAGVYRYAYTDVTAAGESLPSPLGTITVGVTTPPATGPTAGTPTSGTGPDVGAHDYEVTFVTATGETTPGPASGSVTTTATASPIAPTLSSFNAFGSLSAGTYQWACSYVTAGGETIPGPVYSRVCLAGDSVTLNIPVGPAGTTQRKLYRTVHDGAQLKLAQTIANNTATTVVDAGNDAGLGANAPTTSALDFRTVPITAIPLGAAHVTSRKLYRRFNGTGTYKLVATIADNTTTTYSDTVTNASLGAAAPSTNTASGVNQVSISALAVGPSSTTARKIYRTVADGSQLKLQQTVADNTSVVGATDSTADGSLGANVPTADTSGLAQPAGQVNAGSTSILTASAGPFASGGGWALAGQNTIRYTGITLNTLTGVPASGPGSLATTVLYGSQILPAPALTGVTGFTLAALKGSLVHIWVQRDDLAAQALQAAYDAANGITPADGIYEGPLVVDDRRGEDSLKALCDANLALYSAPIVTFTYATRDTKTRSGKTVHIDLPGYPVGDYIIQDVTITELGTSRSKPPRFLVSASTVRFSFDELLRRILDAQKAG